VELRKLLEAEFIKEVFHPTWLDNPVLVKKKNGKWRMCVDYTSLNEVCPKVPFPLPHGMLLGYNVFQRGIEPNPEKVAALDRKGPIRDLNGV
jgi:hypothetical protein